MVFVSGPRLVFTVSRHQSLVAVSVSREHLRIMERRSLHDCAKGTERRKRSAPTQQQYVVEHPTGEVEAREEERRELEHAEVAFGEN